MPASIFAGSKVKTLKSILSLNGGADIISSSTTNPQTSAVSAEPGSILLNTTSGTMYRKLDAGLTTNWVEVGAGSGGKNYIKNPDFDGGATTSWSMQKVSLSSLVPTGNIGAPDAGHTIATSSSSPLEGANSLLVQGASAFTAGNCLVSAAFAIDREDMAKVMGWSFYYEAVTSNMDFSGTSAGTWAVYIAEVTTATPDTVVSWIQPAGVYNLVQGSGVGIASGTFQTTATGTAYRLVLVCINSEAAATTLKVDDFQLGPQKVLAGAAISDWVSYTPTFNSGFSVGTGGFATNNWKYRRVGDSIEVKGRVIFGTAGNSMGSGNFTVSIPSGLSIDINKLDTVASFNSYGAAGVAWIYDGAGTFQREVYFINRADTSLTSVQVEGRTDAGVTGAWTSAFPIAWGSDDTMTMIFTLPIQGWSSNTVMSQDTDTRVVAARMTRGTTQAFSTGEAKIQVTTATLDTHGTFDSSNNRYYIPISGYYRVGGVVTMYPSVAVNDIAFGYRIDGSGAGTTVYLANNADATNVAATFLSGFDIVLLKAGQYIEFYASSTTNASIDPRTKLSVERLSGPATIAASETCAASYGTVAATTLTSGANTLIPFAIKNFDTHSAFSGSTYTVPLSGLYRYTISAYSGGTTGTTTDFQLNLYKNGAATKGVNFPKSGTAGTPLAGVMSVTVKCNAGDTLQAYIYNGTSGAVNLLNNDTYNWFCVERIGN